MQLLNNTYNYSNMSCYNECPWKFGKLYIDKVEYDYGYEGDLGTFCHEVLKQYQIHLIKKEMKEDKLALNNFINTIWSTIMKKYKEDQLLEGRQILSGININVDTASSIETIARVGVSELKTNISGRFDRIDIIDYPKIIRATDWKTDKWETNIENFEKDLQYIIYSYLIQMKYPQYEEHQFRIHYLRSGNIIDSPVMEFEKSKTMLFDKIKNIQNANDLPATRNKFCDRCNFYKTDCPLNK